MSTLIPNLPPVQAALINISDDSGLIGLIVLLIVVGIVVWLALWVLDNFGQFIAQPFNKAIRMLIIFVAVIVVLDKALEVIFGISLF